MKFRKEDFVDCVGSVTIVTENLIIFQGQVKRHEDRCNDWSKENAKSKDDAEFIVLILSCIPAIIGGGATIQPITPELFQVGDTIRINLDEIVAIGPSSGCFEPAG